MAENITRAAAGKRVSPFIKHAASGHADGHRSYLIKIYDRNTLVMQYLGNRLLY